MSQRTTNGQMGSGGALWRGFVFLGLFCFLLALAGQPLPVAAAGAWFVSPSGDDAHSCTILLPCRTIGVALGKAADGDTIYAAAGLYNEHLVIDKSVRIVGANTNTTKIDGMSNGRVVQVMGGVSVTLSALTIQNGHTTGAPETGAGVRNLTNNRLTLSAVKVISNVVYASSSDDTGGGIENDGVLTITNSTISGNWAYLGGGIVNVPSGTMVMSNTVLTDNSAYYSGGLQNFGSASLSQVTISANTAVTRTGGIGNELGTLTMTNSTINGNSAPLGGGIFNKGTVTLTNTTISGNQATSTTGGGIWNEPGATVTLNNVTMSGNSAPGGGGFFSWGVMFIKNTILSNSPSGGNCVRVIATGSVVTSLGYNLSSDSSCSALFTNTGDLNNKDPLLTPLANWGGPTLVHGLSPGSPALDAGNPATPGNGGNACAATDQRGVARPIGTRCDIGAFEGTPVSVLLPLIRK